MDKLTQNKKLRHLAEESLASQQPVSTALSHIDATRLIHELQVHQIELDMQYEALQLSRAEVDVAQRKYTDLYSFAPVGYLVLDKDGTIRQTNLMGARIIGVNQGSLVGRRLAMFVADSDLQLLYEFVNKVFATRTQQACEMALATEERRSDCHFVKLDGIISPDGQECNLVISDITTRKNDEERLRLLFQGSPDPIILVDNMWALRDLNHAYEVMTGYTRAELLSMTTAEVKKVMHVAFEVLQTVIGALSQRRQVDQFEMTIESKNGTRVDVEVNIHPVTMGAESMYMASLHDISARKQAEEALRDSEGRFREMLDYSVAASYKRNAQTRSYGYTSPVFTRICGYSPDEMKNMTFEAVLNLMHPDDVADVNRVVAEVLSGASGATYQVEYRLRHKDGQYRWLMDQFSVMRDAAGQVWMIGSMSDISERKHAEQALLDKNWRMESIIEGARAGTWEWNAQTGETIFNEVWAQLIGYTLEELAPIDINTWERFANPDDLEKSNELMEQHLSGQLPSYDCEVRMRHKDGHWVWVHDHGRIITRTADGKPLMIFGTHVDISEPKHTQGVLQESEVRFKVLADTAPVLVWTSGVDARCDYFNRHWLEFTGRTLEQELGNGWSESVHPNDVQHCMDTYLGSFKARREFKTEYRLRRADGEYRWLMDNGVPRFTPEGVFAGYIGSCFDITINKQAEAAMRESEARYRTVVEWSPNAIVIHRGGVILYVNPAAVSLFGATSAQDLTGHPVIDRVHPDYQQSVLDQVHNGIDSSVSAPMVEMSYVKLDGTIIDVEVQGVLIAYDGTPTIQATMRDVTERNSLRTALQRLATTDELTSLLNRRHFIALASGELKRAAHQKQPPALVMLDVDRLKHVNDTYGHAAGDQVLVTFSDECKQHIRDIDVFARIGGDEFALLLPETTSEEAYQVVERVRLALAARPLAFDGQQHVVTISAGIAIMADARESLDTLLARADLALYRAKEAGRNRTAT